MENLKIPRALAQEMIEHARRDAPIECCGVLAGTDGTVARVYPTTNIDRSPVKYTIDPADMPRIFRDAEQSGHDILAFYHSHTSSEAYPSVTDVKLVPPADLFDYLYVIVSVEQGDAPVIRSFRIVDKRVEEVPLVVTD